MTSGSVWARAQANDTSAAPATISAVAAARNTVSSSETAGWGIASLLVSIPDDCGVEASRGVCESRIPLNLRDLDCTLVRNMSQEPVRLQQPTAAAQQP